MNPKVRVHLPEGMVTVPFQAPRQAELPPGMTDVPLVDKNDPAKKQIQERLLAHIKVFDFTKEQDVKEYEDVWQAVSDGKVKVCEHRLDMKPDGSYQAFFRYAELQFLVPQAS